MSNVAQVSDPFQEIFNLLKAGDFQAGWPLHEQRWQSESMKAAAALLAQRNFKVSLWLGKESLAGKTIFIWPEQGHGDVMQFVRFVNDVANLGGKVLLAAHTAMIRLFKQSFTHPNIEVVLDLEEHDYQFDFHCPIMSMPLACRVDSLDKIPSGVPYLFSPQVDEPQAILRVGLVWAGGAKLDIDAERSLSLRQLQPLMVLAGTERIQFFSLQMGEAAMQLADVPHAPITDLTANVKDWADTAALVAHLDLVISVDTAVAHLAAAMGKPTWVLSRFNGCWRWFEGRDDSPWYPTVRLFRQKTRGDWDGVMAEVAAALASYNG
jgi:Glycosyltransferase family 9 (heptosyltransferase)